VLRHVDSSDLDHNRGFIQVPRRVAVRPT